MPRLRKEGLSRHDALHAIGSVAAEYIFEALKTKDAAFANAAQASFNATVERLTAKEWRQRYGS